MLGNYLLSRYLKIHAQHRSAQKSDWDSILYGEHAGRLPLSSRLRSHTSANRMAALYLRKGVKPSLERLSATGTYHPNRALLPLHHTELAWQVRGLIRALYGDRKCFFESLTVAYGLRLAGVAAYMVIGYEQLPSQQNTQLHAWVESESHVLVDDPFITTRFKEITRYPK